jgi:hypothetical protein
LPYIQLPIAQREWQDLGLLRHSMIARAAPSATFVSAVVANKAAV